jgi:4-hydroxy-tetrahydrodipicolinate reductase
MGRLIVALAREDASFRVAGAIEAPAHAAVGRDAGELAGGAPLGVRIGDDLGAACAADHVVLDFTTPAATLAHVRVAAGRGAGLVVGTTGFSAEQERELRGLAARTRTVLAPNMSVGVTVLLELVGVAARLLDPTYEAEIVEIHHHAKKDAPSGTALALGRAVAAARGQDFARAGVLAREGLVGARRPDEMASSRCAPGMRSATIPSSSVASASARADPPGAEPRRLARGALRAARWVAGRQPGVYSMRDVLGL